MFKDNQLNSFLRVGCVVYSESAIMISKLIFKVELSRFHQVCSSHGEDCIATGVNTVTSVGFPIWSALAT